jgi:hypothetical protein
MTTSNERDMKHSAVSLTCLLVPLSSGFSRETPLVTLRCARRILHDLPVSCRLRTNWHRQAVPRLRRLVAGFTPRRPGFEPGSGHVGFMVDKVALGQVFSENFGFPCQFASHRLLHNHHPLSSRVGTIG